MNLSFLLIFLKDQTAIAAVASSQQVQVVLDALDTLGVQGQVGRLVIARRGVQHPGLINNDSQLSSPTGAAAETAVVEEAETVGIEEEEAEEAAVNPPLQIYTLFRQRYHLSKVFLFKSHPSRFNKLSRSSRPKHQVYASSRLPRSQCPEHQDIPDGNHCRNMLCNL
jgi:hypothetical protein